MGGELSVRGAIDRFRLLEGHRATGGKAQWVRQVIADELDLKVSDGNLGMMIMFALGSS